MKNRRKSLATVIAIAMIAIVTLIALPMTAHVAHADGGLGGTYIITSFHTGKVIDDAGWSKNQGTQLQQWSWGGWPGQQQEWTLIPLGDGSYEIQNVNSGLVFDVPNATTTWGAIIQQWGWNNSDAQHWWVDRQSNGYYKIWNKGNGLVLDTGSAGTGDGGKIQQWSWNGSNNQLWGLLPTSNAAPVTPSQFNQLFPSRNGFYTFDGYIGALSDANFRPFATTGNTYLNIQDMAAFLANISHETGNGPSSMYNGLTYTDEIQQAAYCNTGSCPYWYYGRGPIQISWSSNYQSAGNALGVDLINHPGFIDGSDTSMGMNNNDAIITWQTGMWYWMTQNGPSWRTADAAVNGNSFGDTIRAINGGIECGQGPGLAHDEMMDRVNRYNTFSQIAGVNPIGNETC